MHKIRTQNKIGIMLLATMLLTIGLAAMPAQAAATNEKIIIDHQDDFCVYVPCTGEIVHLTGTMHLVSHAVSDKNGGEHRRYMSNAQLKGVSDSGIEYTASRVLKSNLFYGNGSADTYSYNYNFHMIGKGQAENFMVHGNYEWTRTPDGTFKLTGTNFHSSCE